MITSNLFCSLSINSSYGKLSDIFLFDNKLENFVFHDSEKTIFYVIFSDMENMLCEISIKHAKIYDERFKLHIIIIVIYRYPYRYFPTTETF